MGERIQHELDKIKKLAMAKNESFFSTNWKSFLQDRNSLAKAIKTKEEADKFLAELEWASEQAQRK